MRRRCPGDTPRSNRSHAPWASPCPGRAGALLLAARSFRGKGRSPRIGRLPGPCLGPVCGRSWPRHPRATSLTRRESKQPESPVSCRWGRRAGLPRGTRSTSTAVHPTTDTRTCRSDLGATWGGIPLALLTDRDHALLTDREEAALRDQEQAVGNRYRERPAMG